MRFKPKGIEAILDGEPVPFEKTWEKGRRCRVAKIGDPNSYVGVGSHTYEISYRVDGALSPTGAGRGTFASSSWSDTPEAQSAPPQVSFQPPPTVVLYAFRSL